MGGHVGERRLVPGPGLWGTGLLMAQRGPVPSVHRHGAAAAEGQHLLPGTGGCRVHLLRAAAGGPELPLQQQWRVRGEQPGRQPQVAGAGGGHWRPPALPVPALAGCGEWGAGEVLLRLSLTPFMYSAAVYRAPTMCHCYRHWGPSSGQNREFVYSGTLYPDLGEIDINN